MAIPTRPPTPLMATGSGWRTASPRCAGWASMGERTICRSPTASAAATTRSSRRACSPISPSATPGRAAASRPRSRRAPSSAGRRRRAMTGSNSSTIRPRSPRRRSPRRGRAASAPSRISARAGWRRSMPIAPPRWGCTASPTFTAISNHFWKGGGCPIIRPTTICSTSSGGSARWPGWPTRSSSPGARSGALTSSGCSSGGCSCRRPLTSIRPGAT